MKTIFKKLIGYATMILAGLGILASVNSCVEEDMPYIVLDQEEIEVGTEAEKYTIDVKANVPWSATCAQDWIVLYNPEGQFKGQFDFEVQANETTSVRTAMISVSSPDGSTMATVQIVQAPKAAGLYLTEEAVTFNKNAQSRKIRVVSNHKWNVISSDDWCTVTPTESSASGDIEITVEENISGETRKANVSVICEVNVDKPIIRTIEVTQAGSEFYFSIPTKQFYLAYAETTLDIPYDTTDPEVEIRLSTNVDWIELEDSDVLSTKSMVTVRDFISVKIIENSFEQERTGTITATILSKGQQPINEHITIVQAGTKWAFTINTKEYSLDKRMDTLYVTGNLSAEQDLFDFDFASNVSWITLTDKVVDTDRPNQKIWAIAIDENKSEEVRKATLTFSAAPKSINGDYIAPIVQTISISQLADELDLFVPVKNYYIEPDGDRIYLNIISKDAAFMEECNVDWLEIQHNPYNYNELFIDIFENYDVKARHGQVTFYTNKVGATHITQTIDIYQEAYPEYTSTIHFDVTSMEVSPKGQTINIPFTASERPENITVSDEELCTAYIDQFNNGTGVIIVNVTPNLSGRTREMIVNASITSYDGEGASASITLIQKSDDIKFELSTTSMNMDFNTNEKYITLESMVNWSIKPESVPTWLQISPMDGTGNTAISLKAEKNEMPVQRSTNIIISTDDNTKSITLAVVQDANPDVLNPKLYGYLGRGYNARGLYANNKDVKAPVLDINKLYAGNFLDDIKNPNNTVETTILGKTSVDYVTKYAKAGGIQSLPAYKEAVNRNFSPNAFVYSEQQFGTVRQVYKQEIIKLYDGTTADQIINCVSEGFANDIQKLTAEQLVLKYGTHVITGLSYGGALEYNMSANIYNLNVNFQHALTAGYEQAYHGNTVLTIDAFNEVKNNGGDFEQSLIVNGGDITVLNADCTSNNQTSYDNWINSLADRSAWVVASFEGPGLMPLDEFINDPDKKAAVSNLIEQKFQEDNNNFPQTTTSLFTANINIADPTTNLFKEVTLPEDPKVTTLEWTVEATANNNPYAMIWEGPLTLTGDSTQDPILIESKKMATAVQFSTRVKNQTLSLLISNVKCTSGTDPDVISSDFSENISADPFEIVYTFDIAQQKWANNKNATFYGFNEALELTLKGHESHSPEYLLKAQVTLSNN